MLKSQEPVLIKLPTADTQRFDMWLKLYRPILLGAQAVRGAHCIFLRDSLDPAFSILAKMCCLIVFYHLQISGS
jgi:hypothetical protein